jgi:hypothetical protein
MKKPYLIGQCILVAVGAFLLQSVSVFAEGSGSPPPGGMAEHSRNFDWIQHTQRTMDELKGKLNLAPEQMAAWNTWSRGVIKDAQQQLEQKKSGHEKKNDRTKPMITDTTPERMARGIERLRAETIWMQEHLVQLDAALVRTNAFYNKLDTNQKTIFDLFWHELYHRVSGHDDDYEGSHPNSMMGEYDDPSGGH